MGNFENDTQINGGNGDYEAILSRDWEIWGPNGGYISAIALRAAGIESHFKHPASFTCQYLKTANFDKVTIKVEKLREGTLAEALKVSILQNNKRILEALVWTIDEIPGYEHDLIESIKVKSPHELKSFEELQKPKNYTVRKFWDNLERRPLTWDPKNWNKGLPIWQEWYRFRPQATFNDLFIDAARSLLLIDTMQWPALASAYGPEYPYLAPSIDLYVQFHRLCPEFEWLFCDASTKIAHNGIAAGNVKIWSESGFLIASGASTLLCRKT